MIYTVASIILVALGLLYLFRRTLLRAVAGFLVVSPEAPQPCDAVVLMNGNISTRPYRAAELARENDCPVYLARLADTQEVRMGIIPNISEATQRLLIELGVPESQVRLVKSERWIGGTWDEALLLCPLLKADGHLRVSIVSDAFHTRRARWTFSKMASNPEMSFNTVSSRYSEGIRSAWWVSEYGLVQLVVEYLKLGHYAIRFLKAGKNLPRESDLPMAREVRPIVSGRREL